MLHVYVCEDNANHLSVIKKHVENTIMIENMDMELKLATQNPFSLLEALENNQANNIYFLDVDLKAEINGLELASRIRKVDPRGYIVFVTTHAEMSYLTFQYQVEAFDFIIKDSNQLKKKIHDSLLMINERHYSTEPRGSLLTLKYKDKVITEQYDDIYLFEIGASSHKIVMIAENRQIEFNATLKGLETQLDQRFCRCSDSCIINTDKIKYIDKKVRTITLTNEEECTISVRKMKDVLRHVTGNRNKASIDEPQ